MGWLKDIFVSTFGNRSAEFKAITEELKALRDEWKAEALANRHRVSELEQAMENLQEHERNCQNELIRIRQDHRDLKEEVIFLKRNQRP